VSAPLPEVVAQVAIVGMFVAAAAGAAADIRSERSRRSEPSTHVTNFRPTPYDWQAEDRHPLSRISEVAPRAVPVAVDGIGARSQRPGEIAS
jgi:hypothetical protein